MSGSRELKHPRSKKQDQDEKAVKQDNFGRGMIKNAPHEDLPDYALAYLRNAHAYPTEVQPRLPAVIYSTLQPPALAGRTGYSAHKDGNVITSDSGNIFTEDDVTHYFVWPGDPNNHDGIIAYISPTQVRVADTTDRDITANCWMHAKMNLWEMHSTQKKVVYQWGSEVYVADPEITAIEKAICLSIDSPSNAISDWTEKDEHGLIVNSAGNFLLNFDDRGAITICKENTGVPSVLVESNTETKLKTHRYDYLYSMSKIYGNGIYNRVTPGCPILLESGTVALNTNTIPPRDYGSVWTEKKAGGITKIQGRLVCGTMLAANRTPTYWNGLTDATFQLTVDERTENFLIDFSPTDINVQSMDEVATAIQSVIRTAFTFATCRYDYEEYRFVFTSGEQNGSTIGYGQAGIGGTDVSAIMLMRDGDAGASIDNSFVYQAPVTVGILTAPANGNDPLKQERHWTHYSVYRTCDIGPSGNDPRSGSANSPFKFTWTKDLRISASFYAYMGVDGIIVAVAGEFEDADEGSSFEWEDGDIDTIYEVIDSTHANTRSLGEVDYNGDVKPLQAAAIGGGRVIRIRQSGTVVTREGGDGFTADDVGGSITWPSGELSYISEYVSADIVYVHDSNDRELTGGTIDPVSRSFSDVEDDDNLRDRQGELIVGLLNHRYYRELPPCNVGIIVPGFLITAVRGDRILQYSQLDISRKYMSGYHIDSRQKSDRIEGSIQKIIKVPNKFIVFCINSTWGGNTNVPDIKSLPEFGQSYAILHVDIIDERIGVKDIGSIQEVDYGIFEMRCSDGSWRQFNGLRYTDDMSVDKETGQDIVKRDLNEMYTLSSSVYSDKLGHIIWGLKKNVS